MALQVGDFLYRFWSSESAGGLSCGRLEAGELQWALNQNDVLAEFDRHRDRFQDQPTALVSTSSSLLRVLSGAYDRLARGDDEESIFIAFMMYNPTRPPHHARVLAEQLGLDPSLVIKFQTEFCFEWTIPEDLVVQIVDLATIHRRGFRLPESREALRSCGDFSLDRLGKIIRDRYRYLDEWTIGWLCGGQACAFGLDGPILAVALSLANQSFTSVELERGARDGIAERLIDIWEHQQDIREELDTMHMDKVGDLSYELTLYPWDSSLQKELEQETDWYEDARSELRQRY